MVSAKPPCYRPGAIGLRAAGQCRLARGLFAPSIGHLLGTCSHSLTDFVPVKAIGRTFSCGGNHTASSRPTNRVRADTKQVQLVL